MYQKCFFHCWSNKREIRSKWEPNLRDSFVIVSKATTFNSLPIILSFFTCQNVLTVWIKQKSNMIQIKNWLWFLHLCQISTFFLLIRRNSCKSFHVFDVKVFFYCRSNKMETRSKWEPNLRDSFVIVSNTTTYKVLPIIL